MERKKWFHRKPETMLDWLLIVCGAIAFYMVLLNAGYVLGLLQGAVDLLTPFAAGVVIAYIINPVVEWQMKHIFRGRRRWKWLAMLIGYIVSFLLVFLLIYLIVDQVGTSILSFARDLPTYAKNLETALLALQPRFPNIDFEPIIAYLQDLTKIVEELIKVAMGSVPQIMGYFGNMASTFVVVFTALASSIYLLTAKDKLLRQARTLTHAFLPRNVASNVLRICHTANRNLSGFFTGKIIDSAIIGVLTYVCMKLFRMDFAAVISIIVGVTNIIPVFGPFIGAVPGIIILLFFEPIQALWFLILIIIIQQLDGNFIGPTILGDSIGISALWVLFSIVIGGDLFGLVGMVVGVPVFATIYSLIKELAEWCLRSRGLDHNGQPLAPPPVQEAPAPAAPVPAPAVEKAIPRKNRKRNLRS